MQYFMTDQEKDQIIRLIKTGKKLLKEFNFKILSHSHSFYSQKA